MDASVVLVNLNWVDIFGTFPFFTLSRNEKTKSRDKKATVELVHTYYFSVSLWDWEDLFTFGSTAGRSNHRSIYRVSAKAESQSTSQTSTNLTYSDRIFQLSNYLNMKVIGASLSEPHTSESNDGIFIYIYIYIYIYICRTSFCKNSEYWKEHLVHGRSMLLLSEFCLHSFRL